MYTTTLLVTHDQEEALSVADRVGVVRAGRLEQVAAPQELYRRPATPFVAEFVGQVNRVPCDVDASGADVLGRRLELLPGSTAVSGRGTALLRPEDVEVHPEAAGAAGVTGWRGTVVQLVFLGAATRAVVQLDEGGEPLVVHLAARSAEGTGPGARVVVRAAEVPVLVR